MQEIPKDSCVKRLHGRVIQKCRVNASIASSNSARDLWE